MLRTMGLRSFPRWSFLGQTKLEWGGHSKSIPSPYSHHNDHVRVLLAFDIVPLCFILPWQKSCRLLVPAMSGWCGRDKPGALLHSGHKSLAKYSWSLWPCWCQFQSGQCKPEIRSSQKCAMIAAGGDALKSGSWLAKWPFYCLYWFFRSFST